MVFCIECGTELRGRYCAHCGAAADGTAAGDASTPPAPVDTVAGGPVDPPASARRRRRLLIGAVVVGALLAAAVPATLMYRDRAADAQVRDERQAREQEYVTRVRKALVAEDLVDADIPESLLLDVGREMCAIYADGGDLGDAMDAFGPDSSPGPADETVEEFVDRTSEPITQILVSGYLAAGSARVLCPEHGVLADK